MDDEIRRGGALSRASLLIGEQLKWVLILKVNGSKTLDKKTRLNGYFNQKVSDMFLSRSINPPPATFFFIS